MSDDSMLWQLLFQLMLILINAIFACAEIAVISMNDGKLAKLTASGDKSAMRLSKLLEQPSRFLATIQVGITLAGFMGSAFAADNFSDRIVDYLIKIGISIPENTLNTISVVFITIILSYFTLVLGELVPKRIAMRNADKLALSMSGLIWFISKVFSPIVFLLTNSTNALLRLIGIDPNAQIEEITEEEIRMMVDQGSENGTIDQTEKEMIQNVFEFDDKNAGEIMTHRIDAVMLWLDESDEEWEKTITENRHNIYPVCGESTDDIIGILNTKYYFRMKNRSRDNVLTETVKPAYFVPETVRADILFRNMKKSRNHFAIVLDEYGGMSGIITINDLLEELVGDLEDDSSVPGEPPPIERIDSQTWKIQGSVSLDLINEQLGFELPEDDYDTLAGLVFGLLGSVPEDGSTPELEEYGLKIKVTEIKDHRLESAIVCKIDKTDTKKEKER